MVKFIPCLMISLLLVTSLGCQIGIKGSGVAKTETRELADFKSISNEAVGDVVVTIGDSQSVEVTIDDNLMPLLVTEVENGVLKIKTTGSFSTSIGLSVKVTVPSLESLRSSGVGSVKVDGLKSENFSVVLSGVGGISAKGEVKTLDVEVSGVGSADLGELVAEDVTVTVSGVGGAVVHATNSVNASTSGVGGIEVRGNPGDRKEKKSGVGSIKFE